MSATEESHETDLSSFRGRASVGEFPTQRSGLVGSHRGPSFRGTLRDNGSNLNNSKQLELPLDDDDDNDEETSAAI